MAVTRLIAVNGNSGAYTAVSATIPARTVEIVEDGSVAAQGLEVRYPADGFATTNTVPYGQEPINITGAGKDGLAGLPAQNSTEPDGFNYRPADVYCQVRSATATATTVRVVETETT
ncbi:MAG TPA: hypothetical protein VIC54_11375 [Terriglobales bacterium]|jgi:hypothetical protein